MYICHADSKPMVRATFETVFNKYFKQSCTIIWANNGEHSFYGDRSQTTVWNIGREGNYKHPTMKPIELMGRAIYNSSKEDDIVLDLLKRPVVSVHAVGVSVVSDEVDIANARL